MPFSILDRALAIRDEIARKLRDRELSTEEQLNDWLDGLVIHMPDELLEADFRLRCGPRPGLACDADGEWVLFAREPTGRVRQLLVWRWRWANSILSSGKDDPGMRELERELKEYKPFGDENPDPHAGYIE